MKIQKVDGAFLRLKLADGSIGKENFTVSMIANGSGILIEFDDAKYLVSTEEIVKEVMRLRGEAQ